MKGKIAITLALAFLFCGFESVWCQAKPAQKVQPVKHLTVTAQHKTTFLSVLASAPKGIVTVMRVGTDTLEYVTGKIATVAGKIDAAADAAEVYLSNVQ